MTSREAENFINTELKGLWPDWTPTDAEVRLWLRELMKVDYSLTKGSVSNWYIAQENHRRRPTLGRLRKHFRKTAANVQEQREASEPVLLFEIVKESNITERTYEDLRTGEDAEYTSHIGQRFFINHRENLPSSPHNIEAEAERMRQRFNEIYGNNHIVIRSWENLYENDNADTR